MRTSERELVVTPWIVPYPQSPGQRARRAAGGYVNVRLIVRVVGVTAAAPDAKATCVAGRARAGRLRIGSPAASGAGRTTLTWPWRAAAGPLLRSPPATGAGACPNDVAHTLVVPPARADGLAHTIPRWWGTGDAPSGARGAPRPCDRWQHGEGLVDYVQDPAMKRQTRQACQLQIPHCRSPYHPQRLPKGSRLPRLAQPAIRIMPLARVLGSRYTRACTPTPAWATG